MPTYDYQCTACHHQLEVTQSITEEPLTRCPECKGETLQRGIGGGAAIFRFVGDGFYITDSKKSRCHPSCDGTSCKKS